MRYLGTHQIRLAVLWLQEGLVGFRLLIFFCSVSERCVIYVKDELE